MSAPDPHLSRKTRIDPRTKAAIVSQVMAGASQASIAQDLGIHRNTVSRLVQDVAKLGGDPSKLDWRKRLADDLPSKSVDAIERSVSDTEDVHRAASTGLSVLKGLGHLANDAPTTNVAIVIQQINSLPEDLRQHYLCSDVVTQHVTSDVTPHVTLDVTDVTQRDKA